MNERIKQLAEQAEETLTWKEFNDDGHSEVTRTKQQVNIEKFAELIVQECAKVARSQTLEKYPGMKSEYDGIVYVEEAIKQHFGVEE